MKIISPNFGGFLQLLGIVILPCSSPIKLYLEPIRNSPDGTGRSFEPVDKAFKPASMIKLFLSIILIIEEATNNPGLYGFGFVL